MNKNKQLLVDAARTTRVPFWLRIADDLSKGSRRSRIVNLSRISRCSKPGETVVVPGKVLGDGNISHKVTVVAYSFSHSALEKLKAAKCTTLTLSEFIKKNPKGTGRLIG